MKTKEEIELLAKEEYKDNLHNPFFTAAPMGYIKGYTQCQEDIIEALEMHILLNEHDWNRNPQAQLNDFINSLKK
jgi:hypothetical protein